MKCSIPEISWHNREPVLSVDLHPLTTNFYKLATGGGDCHVIVSYSLLSLHVFSKIFINRYGKCVLMIMAVYDKN